MSLLFRKIHFVLVVATFLALFGLNLAFTTNQSASLVIGQAAFNTNGGALSATQMNGPMDVWIQGMGLVTTEETNERCLLFNSIPSANGASADVVIGQPNFITNTGNNGGPSAQSDLNSRGVCSYGSKLFFGDKDNNRTLIFNSIPVTNFAAADVVVGQPDMATTTTGTTQSKGAQPHFVFTDGTHLFVGEDTNNRVLIYNSIPTTNGAAADVVVGQLNFISNAANQGGAPTSQTLHGPRGICLWNGNLVVADRYNNRVLIYNGIPSSNDAAASLVLGQPDMVTTTANTGGMSAKTLFDPYGIASDGVSLYVADMSNNRILIYNSFPTANQPAADEVIGQAAFNTANAPNPPTAQSLNQPHGVYSNGTGLFIADTLNNRVLAFGPTPTPTGTAISACFASPNLDLKVRVYQCVSDRTGYEILVKNNDTTTAVKLSDLTVKIWAYDTSVVTWGSTTYYDGGLYDNGGGSFQAVTSPFTLTTKAFNCTSTPGRLVNWELDVNNASTQTILTNGGYWIDGQFDVTSSAGAFVPGWSNWYSQFPAGQTGGCSATSNQPGSYVDDLHYALYYQGNLVNERAGTDPNTGVVPCAAVANLCTSTITPTATNTATNTVTKTATQTPTNTPTNTLTNTATQTPTNTLTNTATNTVTNTLTATPSGTPTGTPSSTATRTPTPTSTNTATNTPTNTTTGTATATPSNTTTNTPTNTATNTPTATSTQTPTNTSTNTATNTLTATPSSTPTGTATITPTSTPSSTPTNTATNSPTATPSNTATSSPSNTPTPTVTNSPTATATGTPTNTLANTATSTATSTATNTATLTATGTATNTATFTPTGTPTASPTSTASNTPTNTFANTATNTPTSTVTNTATITATPTVTSTSTLTASYTPTSTATNTATLTPTGTPTGTPSNSPTLTPSNTPTASPTSTATNTATNTASNTPSFTPTGTPTVSPTSTVSSTPTSTFMNTATNTPTSTATNTSTATPSSTPTGTLTKTATSTVTQTPTLTASNTPTTTTTLTATQTATRTSTGTATQTPTITLSSTPTGTATRTATASPSSTQTNTATATITGTLTPSAAACASEAVSIFDSRGEWVKTLCGTLPAMAPQNLNLAVSGFVSNPSTPGGNLTLALNGQIMASWDATDKDGNVVPNGFYHLIVTQSFTDGTKLVLNRAVFINPHSQTAQVQLSAQPNIALSGGTILFLATVEGNPVSGAKALKIYAVSGELVKTLDLVNGQAAWDLTNSPGQKVSSGIYLIDLDVMDPKTGNPTRKIVKVVVLR